MAVAIKTKPGKAVGPSEMCTEITASEEAGICMMMELCQRLLNGKGMPDKWRSSVLVSIFKGNGDVRDCNPYGGESC